MIKRENVADLYPLTPFQEGLFYQEMLEESTDRGGERANHLQVRFRLAGPLDEDAFGRAWQALVDRHDVLRTAFPRNFRDRPLQLVARQVPFVLDREAMEDVAPSQRDAALAARAQQRRSQPLALDRPPAMRALCVRFDHVDHGIVWDFHHILLDGWCIGTLQKDLADLYRAAVRREAAPANSALSFARYVQWHESRRARSNPARWAHLLSGHERAAPYVPGHRAGAKKLARQPASHALLLPTSVADELRALARNLHCTLSDALHALWGAFLTRLSHGHDVLFGSVRAARPIDLAGVDTMVGPSIGMLPIRVACSGSSGLADVLQALRPQRELWAEQPVDALPDILRAAGLTPSAIDHFLVVENAPMAAAYEGERQPFADGIELYDFRFESANDYDFYVRATPCPSGEIRIEFEHDAHSFEPRAIRTLAVRFARFAQEAASQPRRALALIDLLSVRERAVARTLAPASAPSRRSEFSAVWADLVWRHGDKPALRWLHHTFTYRALHEAAAATSARLIRAGAKDGDIVAVPAVPGPAMIRAMVACHLVGLPYLPVDPQWPAAHRTAVLRDSGARWLIGDVPQQWGDLELLKVIDQGDWADDAAGTSGESVWPTPVGRSSTAYVIYTSGTTGTPKGVAVGMTSLLNYVAWTRDALGAGPESASALLTSAAYDLGYTAVFGSLLTGGCLRLLDDDERRDPEAVVRCIVEDGLTFLKATPSYFGMLCASEAWRALSPAQHNLQHVLLGGEAQDFELLRGLHAAHPAVTLWNHYGPTEATIGCIAGPLNDAIEAGSAVQRLGRPIPGADVVICDRELQPVVPGVVGEILLGGVILARGYLGEAASATDRFVSLASQGGRRFYRTGDYGEWTVTGDVVYHGRRDDQVKIQGYRASLSAIAAAVRRLPAVTDAAVLLHGAGQTQSLIAFVVLSAGAPVRAVDWRQSLAEQLPRALTPGQFVSVPAIPLTPNGKLDRKALLIAAESATAGQAAARPAASSPLETRLCAVFAEVLGLGLDSVGPDDDFFALGGHSLKAIRLGSVLRRTVGRSLPLLAVLDHPTPRALANHLESASAHIEEERLIHPMSTADGHRAEVVFFPTLLGTPAVFQGVAQRLQQPVRCWGLRCPASTPESLDALAARLFEELRYVARDWGKTPVVLVGWSFGAYLACETARHFAGIESDRPLSLVLIDIPPRVEAMAYDPAPPGVPDSFANAVKVHFGPGLGSSNVDELVRTADRHARLIDGYRLRQPVTCDVIAIEAEAEADRADMGRWSAWTEGRCTHVSMPTDHHGIVAPEAHGRLAEVIGLHALPRTTR